MIAPLRVAAMSWPDELRKWDHLSDIRFSVVTGTKAERLAALKADADIYIINRENLPWLIEDSGMPFDYDMAVIDELSSFKSWQSARFKSFMKVRPKLKRVVGLTGTPTGNGLMDLFAEYRCLDMGERLGRFIGQYRTAYFRPDKCNGPIVYSYKPLPDAEEEIYRKVADITMSMRAVDRLKMPELLVSDVEVTMTVEERKRYDDMKRDLTVDLPEGELTAANAAALSGKLSQMANGAVYLDEGGTAHIHDEKLDALEDLIEAANGKPMLVAYWYRHDCERIAERLSKLKVGFAQLKSDESIRRWNRGELSVGLIHPASAGHGLNLQSGGSTLVWFGLTWSLELYQQTNARLWRQGQTSSTVIIRHIVTKDTVDERVLKALKTKDDIQTALIDAVKAELR